MKTVYCPNCGEKMIGESAGWRCLKCKGFISFTDGEFYPYIDRPFVRPITNGDRIRAMSDEELAEYLAGIASGPLLRLAEQFGVPLTSEKNEKYIAELKMEYLKRLQSPENGGLTWNG